MKRRARAHLATLTMSIAVVAQLGVPALGVVGEKQ